MASESSGRSVCRVFAPRRGENRGEPHLSAVRALRGPHGLRGAVSNGLGYCEAIEKLLIVVAPPRAQVIRTILTELQRIASPLTLAGDATHWTSAR